MHKCRIERHASLFECCGVAGFAVGRRVQANSIAEESNPSVALGEKVFDTGTRAATVIGEDGVGIKTRNRPIDEDHPHASGQLGVQVVNILRFGWRDDQPVDPA